MYLKITDKKSWYFKEFGRDEDYIIYKLIPKWLMINKEYREIFNINVDEHSLIKKVGLYIPIDMDFDKDYELLLGSLFVQKQTNLGLFIYEVPVLQQYKLTWTSWRSGPSMD